MKAAEFTRRRVRAENEYRNKHRNYTAALRHLVTRSRAVTVIAGNKIVGYRMIDGSVACLKKRYVTEADALLDLARIRNKANHPHVPVRAYRCQWCAGFHLTSRTA